MSNKVSLPKIEDEKEVPLRFKVKQSIYDSLLLYVDAYEASYGVKSTVEVLGPKMLEAFLNRDQSFKKFRTQNKTAGKISGAKN